MFRPTLSGNITTSHKRHSETGQTKEKSDSSEQRVEKRQRGNDCIAKKTSTSYSGNLIKHPTRKPEFVMQESAAKVKRMTWLDRWITSKNNAPVMKSSKTLVQDSTLKEKDFSNSSTKLLQKKSTKLSFVTKTGCADSDTNLSNIYVNKKTLKLESLAQAIPTKAQKKRKKMKPKSCPKISFPLSPSLLHEATGKGLEKTKENENENQRKRKRTNNEKPTKTKCSTFFNNSKEYPYWMNGRTEELFDLIPYDTDSYNKTRVGWIPKRDHNITTCDNENGPKRFTLTENEIITDTPKKKKKTNTSRSKKKVDENSVKRTRKIRVVLNQDQKTIFHRWKTISNFVYNETLRVNESGEMDDIYYETKKGNQIKGWKKTRQYLFDKKRIAECKNYSDKEKEYFLSHELFPRHGKVASIHEYHSRLESTAESLKARKKNPHEFTMKRKDDNHKKQTIYIEVNSGPSVKWNRTGFEFWPRSKMGRVRVKDKRELEKLTKIVGKNESDTRACLTFETPNRYYMCVSYDVRKENKQKNVDDVSCIAFDPGVRTFQTGFDGMKYVEYGNGSIERIYSLSKLQDKLKSGLANLVKKTYKNKKEKRRHKNKRHKMHKKINMLENRVQHLQDDLIHKFSKEACSQYDHVLISKFNVSDMVKKGNRVIGKATTRKMLRWNHYRCRQHMKFKAEITGCKVHEVSEHYTSKACGKCGCLHRKLGGAKIFKCPTCTFKILRDFNGARNIYIMNVEHFVGKINPVLLFSYPAKRDGKKGTGGCNSPSSLVKGKFC